MLCLPGPLRRSRDEELGGRAILAAASPAAQAEYDHGHRGGQGQGERGASPRGGEPCGAEHDLGAAAYAIKAVRAAQSTTAGRVERDWQCDQLDARIRDLVLEDQARRNDICWGVFDD